MRIWGLAAGWLALALAAAPASAYTRGSSGTYADSLDRAVLQEINYARTHPAEYAALLQDGWGSPVLAQDPDATAEAAAFLMRQAPLPPLTADTRLAAAAYDHVRRQGPDGGLGHADWTGEGLSQRLHSHHVWAGLSAETISYGYARPRDVVLQLIIDSGVPGRGHRQVLFDPTLQRAGAGCGPHSRYGEMCVIDFAGAFAER
jgi:uncharacterized protein YkwD